MVDDPPVDGKQARGWDNKVEKLKCEMFCAVLAFIPHTDNDDVVKWFTILFVTTWCLITLGAAFGYADPDATQYGVFSSLVFYFFGRSHGLEIEWLAERSIPGAEVTDSDADNDDQ